jgi:single-stranded DNA-binding protein
MPTIATCTVIGHLYGPCEPKNDKEGKAYTQVRLWTKDKPGKGAEPEFTSWSGFVRGPQAEWLIRDSRKNALVSVSGTIRLAKFTKQDGTVSHNIEFTRVHEVHVLERREQEQEQEQPPQERPARRPATPGAAASVADEDSPPF